ncbi:MAG: hypothetical protein MZW92_17325 [Comamonadaceae bacterium]|nr:hypothetical protein [Comamonadaceae bacterium]
MLGRWRRDLRRRQRPEAGAGSARDPAVVRPTSPTRWCTTASRRGWCASSSTAAQLVRAAAPRWRVPTLLHVGRRRPLRRARPAAPHSRPQRRPALLQRARVIADLCHEIFNEPERDEVLGDLTRWLRTFRAAHSR